jgi:hypothetical protein
MRPDLGLPTIARFIFKEERAKDFTFDSRPIMEMAFESIDEVMISVEEFDDALVDAYILVDGIHVVNASDYTTTN